MLEKEFGDQPPLSITNLLRNVDKMAPNIRRFFTTSSWFLIGILIYLSSWNAAVFFTFTFFL
jgi:hypothetical protein